MKSPNSRRLYSRILAMILALLALTVQLPTTVLASDSGEAAYAATFEGMRRGIRDGTIYMSNSMGLPIENISECSYTFYDIDGNGVNELIFATNGGAAAIYTLSGGKSVSLAQWFGYRDCFAGINTRGYMVGYTSYSAFSGEDNYVCIASDGKSVEKISVIYEHRTNGTVKYTVCTPDGRERVMTVAEAESYISANLEAPLVELTDWKTLTDRSGKIVAVPTSSAVLVNGKTVTFDAYNINDNNYFKLRDLAYILSGTEKQFEVTWDAANNVIRLTSGQAYTPVGGEMSGKGTGEKTPIPTTSTIYLDDNAISLTAYTIEGNNYFKLRDLGTAFDFEVDWDGYSNRIIIDTSKSYTPD